MQARNRAYEDMLRRIHAILRGEVKNVGCDAIKLMVRYRLTCLTAPLYLDPRLSVLSRLRCLEQIYEALFYAPETYWTQSSFMFIVLALQSTTTDNIAANPAGARWLVITV